MSRIAGMTNWLDDRMNPIVVKELRQGMQSRSFIVIVNLLLAALTVICVLAVMTNPDISVRADGGRFIYDFLQGVLFIACFVFVPMYVLIRLRSERDENSVDLFFTTTLKPKRIVQGKFFAGMALIGMLYSVCVPYMLFTYVLRGYDIPSMLLSLGFGLLVAIVVLTATIVVGCWSAPKALGVLVALAWAGLLGLVTYTMIRWSHSILEFGAQTYFAQPGFYAGLTFYFVATFFAHKLFESMAIGLISPPSSNRTLRLRIWASVSIVGLFVVFLGCSGFIASLSSAPFLVELYQITSVWMCLMLPLVMIMLFIAVCEPDGFSNRILLQRPRGGRAVFRPLTFLYTHGASSGVLWALFHAVGMISIYFCTYAWAQAYSSGHRFYTGNGTSWLFLIGLFVLNYALLGKIVMRTFFPPTAAKHTWVAALCSLFALMMATLLISIAIDPQHWDRSILWKFVAPFMADYDAGEVYTYLYFEIIWAAVVFVICLPRTLRDFHEYQAGKPLREPEPLLQQPTFAVAVPEGTE